MTASDVTDVAQVCVGGHTVDLAQHTVTGPEGEVELTPTEWGILEVLVRNAGRLVRFQDVVPHSPQRE